MKKTRILSYLLLFFKLLTFSSCSQKKPAITSEQALDRLMKGNERYATNKSIHPNRCEERRKVIAKNHLPYAIIVGCSDSRVSPEIIFDEGLGDLFVVRVAGNVIDTVGLESIEYSALNLDSKIILVLGHENCGAVSAVVDKNTKDIEAIAKIIEPAVESAKRSQVNDLLKLSIQTNAINMKTFLQNSPNIKKLIQDQKIEVHAAYYNLKTGLVELLDN